jgi:ABC-type polysaccharide/polyol phosphate transport system ATPase subunit
MLNGLIKPDTGRIEMHGRVGALIALGAGFNPILTGRENIAVAGAILGMSQREINARFDAIVEFAELGEFIDSPVQSYSSGMQVRLGFSVAAHLKPDILLLDEVLAVGDVQFNVKCINLIRTLQKDGVTIVLVSHNMTDIVRYANVGMYLGEASIKKFGPIPEVVSLYLQDQAPLVANTERTASLQNFGILLKPVFITDESGTILEKIHPFQKIWLHVPYVLEDAMASGNIRLGLGIDDVSGVFYQGLSQPLWFKGGQRGDRGELIACLDGLRAATGTLSIGVTLWVDDPCRKIGWSRENRVTVESPNGSTGRVELDPVWEYRTDDLRTEHETRR